MNRLVFQDDEKTFLWQLAHREISSVYEQDGWKPLEGIIYEACILARLFYSNEEHITILLNKYRPDLTEFFLSAVADYVLSR